MLADKSAGEILNLAKSTGAPGLAARYALVAGNPFALTDADYSSFSAGGALERFNPATGAGKLSDDYLNARIQFLERAFWFNTQDQNPYNPSANTDTHDFKISPYLRENSYFEDAASGYKIQRGGLFANTPRYYFGDDKANSATGSAVQDRLGTVEVKGKTGVDDKDRVKLGNSWVDQKNGIEYVLEDKGNGVNDLLILSENGSGGKDQILERRQAGDYAGRQYRARRLGICTHLRR
ncbi:MAG: hypothetical protein LZF61_07825 [Nitrosomonas sp.]|nr:MAG: hypothetical protein LZF61_07825 [Nitrosomonas sp.]